jgi:hypothetical protein
VGLAATAATIGTGGTSYAVKAGASLVRAARRLGTLTPTLARTLGDTVDGLVDWSRAAGHLARGGRLEDLADGAKLARLEGLAGDFGRVARNTSVADALRLAAHVETPAEARTLARLSDVRATRTRGTLHALGKARAFRAMHRLSDLARLAIALMAALAAQGVALLLWGLRRAVR